MKIIPLRTKAKDIATGFKGMLTHLFVGMDRVQKYALQPHMLTSDTRQPVKPYWLPSEQLKHDGELVEQELPLDVIGTQVTDEASGFSGMCIGLTLHSSGCVHIDIQPSGTTKEGARVEVENFDIRRCTGPALKKLSEPKRQESERRNPSPSPLASPSR